MPALGRGIRHAARRSFSTRKGARGIAGFAASAELARHAPPHRASRLGSTQSSRLGLAQSRIRPAGDVTHPGMTSVQNETMKRTTPIGARPIGVKPHRLAHALASPNGPPMTVVGRRSCSGATRPPQPSRLGPGRGPGLRGRGRCRWRGGRPGRWQRWRSRTRRARAAGSPRRRRAPPPGAAGRGRPDNDEGLLLLGHSEFDAASAASDLSFSPPPTTPASAHSATAQRVPVRAPGAGRARPAEQGPSPGKRF